MTYKLKQKILKMDNKPIRADYYLKNYIVLKHPKHLKLLLFNLAMPHLPIRK